MTYLDYLKPLAAQKGLLNDFSGVSWYVISPQRKKELELALAREIAEQKICIIPPEITVYKSGLFFLAGELCAGTLVHDNIAEYTEDSLNFLLYEILWSGVMAQDDEFGLAANYPEARNKVKNLAADLRKFMALVYAENKTAELAGALLKPEFSGKNPYKTIFAAWTNYQARRKKYDDSRGPSQRFFTPLEAHAALRDGLSGGKVKPAAGRSFIFENCGLLEPLFTDIAEGLEKSGSKVLRPDAALFRGPSLGVKPDLKGFITTLDEAEYLAWDIKRLLAEGKERPDGLKEGQAALVCFSRELGELLPLALRRFKLLAASPARLGTTGVFKTFRAALAVAFDRATGENEYIELLSARFSTARLAAESWQKSVRSGKKDADGKEISLRKNLRTLLIEAAYKAGHNQNKSLNSHINAVLDLASTTLGADEKAKIDRLRTFKAEGDSPFARILGSAIDMDQEPDDALLSALWELVEKADKAYNACATTDALNRELILDSLLALMAEGEYFPSNEERGDNFLVPVLQPEELSASSARLIYFCGLTGEADKIRRLPVPEKLAREIGLSSEGETYLEKQRRERNKALAEALAGAEAGSLGVKLSYGYINLAGDMAGQSNIVRSAKDAFKYTDVKDGAIPTLHKAEDLMFPKPESPTPDASYALYRAPVGTPADSPMPSLNGHKDIKVLDIYRQDKHKVKQNTDELLELSIGVNDFAEFVNCPRKFLVKLFQSAAGLQPPEDLDTRLRFNKGNFWHAVYERAAKDSPDIFYSADKAKIKQALVPALDALVAEGSDPEIAQDKPLQEFKEESSRLFDKFAANEEARQKELPGLKGLAWEEKHKLEIGTFTANIEGKQKKVVLSLSGKIDRLDYREAEGIKTLHIWDYKTGKPKQLALGKSKSVFGKEAGYAIQLALYGLLVDKNQAKYRQLEGAEIAVSTTGLNIFMDGSIVHTQGGYTGNNKRICEMMPLLKDIHFKRFTAFIEEGTMAALSKDFSSDVSKVLDAEGEIKDLTTYNPNCNWCSAHLCRLASLEASNA